MKKAQATFASTSARSVDANVRGMARALYRILTRIGQREARLAIERMDKRGPRALIRKSAWDQDTLALADLLERYGLRQFADGGKRAASLGESKWVLKPTIKAEMLAELEHKVVLTIAQTRDGVHESLRAIIAEAMDEEPKPTPGQIARRIALKFGGDGDDRAGVFSFGRAERIARTELAQAENAGIAEGFAQSGIERVEWLANTDGLSGGRHHERMNGKSITVAAMNGSDRSKWFLTPLGNRCPWPAWDGLPANDLINCRCMVVPQ